MKRIVSILIPLLLVAGAASAVEGKFGYVDVQKAITASDAGREAKETLSARVKKYQDEINVKQDELRKLKDDLEKQSVVISDAKKADKEKEYSQKLKEFQRYTKDAQDELQAKGEEMERRILEDFEKTAQEYGRKNGFTFIMARSDILLFADEKIDLTDELTRQFNAGRKKK